MRAILLVACIALAGCSNPGGTETVVAPQVVTDPADFAYNDTQEHLHDYWRGQERVTVMDAPHEDLGPGLAGGSDFVVHEYRPASGHVVPQGTRFVDVTLSWQDDALDRYTEPSLWVQTAVDREPRKAASVRSGEVVRMEVNASAWDLPHQLLSAWVFQLRMSEDQGVLRFKGDTHIVVEAERGLPIPLFPAHPDAWEGRDEIVLVDESHQLAYVHDPGDGGCDGFSCQRLHVPLDGELVPHNASLVKVVLALEEPALFTLGVQYHGGEGRMFQRPAPVEDGARRVYEIDPRGAADGPYARQSLWEFMAFIDGPVQDGGAYQSYRLTVTAIR